MKQSNSELWNQNEIQFPRLLAGIKIVGLTPKQVASICESLDITREELTELLDRAEEAFAKTKEKTSP